MLSNAYLLAKIRFDTAENERKFAEILPKIDNYVERFQSVPKVALGATMAREDVSASALQSAVHSKELREKARKEEKPKLRKQCRPPPTHDSIR